MTEASQQAFHILYTLSLGTDDCLQDRDKLRTDREGKCIFGHLDGSPVVRDHLAHEISVNAIGGFGCTHFPEHGFCDRLEPFLIQLKVALRAALYAAPAQYLLHIVDASGLLCNDLLSDVLQRNQSSILQKILRHLNSGLVVGNHLSDKIV